MEFHRLLYFWAVRKEEQARLSACDILSEWKGGESDD